MALEMVCAEEELKRKVPLFTTAPAPEPRVPALEPLPTCKVPEVIVVAEVYVLVADRIKAEVVLSWVTPVTFVPITALIRLEPLPVPVFLTVPVLLTLVVETVKALSVLVLFRSARLPVPVTPPVTVKVPAVLVRVVAVALAVIAPLIVNVEVALF